MGRLPPPDAAVEILAESSHHAQRRLVLEELLAYQLSLKRLREQARDFGAPTVQARALKERLMAGFGFTLTGAQQRVIAEVEADLARGLPMLRLLQGDVGAGKTAVAAAVAADMLEAGYQVALMAPTELLAEQHATTLRRWFEPLGIESMLLTSRLTKSQRKPLYARLESAEPALAVGTH